MEEQKALQRDWSSLPLELLNLIAKKLNEISDFVRFRVVCTTWCLSAPITDLPTQFPWILERKYEYEPHLRFYSVTSNKIRTFHTPNASNKVLYNHSQGYWLAQLWDNNKFGNSQLSMINPLNNDEIILPKFNFDGCPYWIGHQHNQIRKHGVCCALCGPHGERLVFYHVGQDNWHELTLDPNYETCNHFYLKDMLFTIENDTGITKVTDIIADSLVFIVPPVEDKLIRGSVILVEAAGDILRIHQHCYKPRGSAVRIWFDIHRLNVNESGSWCWVKVKDIGDHALFINEDGGGFAHKANDSCGIKANCIYFLNRKYVGILERPVYEVERIDIDTDARQSFLCPFKNQPAGWFVPKLHAPS